MIFNTEHYVGIGFCQPKFYKPHVWQKAKQIMEWLCDNTPHVKRYDFGRGKGKYITVESLPKPTNADLAAIYDNANERLKELCQSHRTKTYFQDKDGLIGVYNHRNVVSWYKATVAGYSLQGETPTAGDAVMKRITE